MLEMILVVVVLVALLALVSFSTYCLLRNGDMFDWVMFGPSIGRVFGVLLTILAHVITSGLNSDS